MVTKTAAMIYAKNEFINVDFGIDVNELVQNTENHNKLFYDKWGIPWKVRKGTLYYGNICYKLNQKHFDWDEACMEGCDLPYKKFFTTEEFLKIKK